MKKARILLADGSPLLMEALSKLLEPEFEVVGMVRDGRALLKTAIDLKPDMVVLDISMPSLNGLNAGHYLSDNLPGIRLIYLTMNQDGDVMDAAFRLGAKAYLLKSCTAADLLHAIVRAWLRPASAPVTRGTNTELFMAGCGKNPRRLTLRQKQVLDLLSEGRSMKQVAFALQIKPRTVAYHKYRMMELFNLSSNAALLRFAAREQVA